ncbi:MAG: hypothetical protein CHACPFDD_03341 [Phycisphaerae bacterium]|nr:hypothetical protein [Phycisphaerae bacterium]
MPDAPVIRPRYRTVALLTAAAVAVAPTIGGCEKRGDAPPPVQSSAETEARLIEPPPTLPTYEFAPDVEARYPDVAAFVKEFLATCLAGRYSEYRLMVSRRRNPESESRFRAIYHAIRSVVVQSIEAVEHEELPAPSYLVISRVELDPARRDALRVGSREIAILVFQEDGEWRMLPAPADLQPERPESQPASEPAVPPAAPMPVFRWDLGDPN